jgi:hypothetical protein
MLSSLEKKNLKRDVFLSVLFALYVVVPAVTLCFTVDNQTAKIYTTNPLLLNTTAYTVYSYDWFFLLYAYSYIVFAMLVWAIFQYLLRNYPTFILPPSYSDQPQQSKPPSQHKINFDSLLGIVLFGYIFAFYVGVGARISLQWYFILIIFAYLIPYTILCNLVDFKFKTPTRKRNAEKNKNPPVSDNNQFLTLLSITVFSLLLAIYYVEIASNTNLILVTKVSIAIGIVLIVFTIIYFLKKTSYTIHLHHFIWGTMIVLITGLDSWFMLLMQAFAIAVHLHGISVFGYDKIVYEDNPRISSLSTIREEEENPKEPL